MWKYLKSTLSKRDFFGKRFFCSFENSLLGYSRSLFSKGKPWRPMPISVFFGSQCPKIMVLSKALKAKLSSIPNGVASPSMPDLDWSEKPPSLDLRSTTRRGNAPALGGPLEAPISIDWCVWFTRCFECSLSLLVEEGICLPLEVWQDSWPNFKGVTKGKWSRHQSLGFSKVRLVNYF